MKSNADDSIKVFIRVRPFNAKQTNTNSCVTFDNTNVEVRDKQPDHRFSFDQVFGMNSTQHQIFQKVGHNVVDSAFQGFNGTIFAYGQTSSGKTHTCIGPDYTDPELQGLLPRMVDKIFTKIQQAPTFIEFRIKITMVEIYMEKIKDLFDINKTDIKIRERQGKGIYLQDVSQEYVASASETMELIKRGISQRSVGQTNMNDTSSRSHMAFIITLYQNNLKDASAKSGKITLVDLAGSQKVSKTGAQGKVLDEAKQINKSLSSLGNVINALTENKISHIPYRDSKLTRLLQESLGGNSKTNLIINVSPSSANEQETLSSLRFGYRAKQIKNKPKVNKEYTVAELLLLLEKSQKKIQELQQIIRQLTTSKKKTMEKRSSVKYVQNLLDSDNPIQTMTEVEADTYQKQQYNSTTPVKSRLSKKYYDSEYPESQDEQKNLELTGSVKKLSEANKALQQDKEYLAEEVQLLSIEKVQLLRQVDLVHEKYSALLKENKVTSHKVNNIQKENEKLLQKYVVQNSKNEELSLKVQQLEDKIASYEQKIISIGVIPEKATSRIFGSSELTKKTKQMVSMVKKNKKAQQSILIEEKVKQQRKAERQKDEMIEQLMKKSKNLEEQITLYRHLEDSKQAFIKQKLKFSSENQRMINDLQNRIEKVCLLEEQLDDQKQKTKYYAELIKSQQSEKNRKILHLQKHLNEVSENYYVLKGQQDSWRKDNKKTQNKIETKNKRIVQLQKEVIGLKADLENYKIQVDELQESKNQESIFNFDMDNDVDEEKEKKSKIVKIIRNSAAYKMSDLQLSDETY